MKNQEFFSKNESFILLYYSRWKKEEYSEVSESSEM